MDYLEPNIQSAPPLAIDTTVVPSTATENMKYAGFWIRFVAYIIDSLVSFVFSAAITAILVFGFKVTSFEGALKYLLQLIGFIFWFFYYVFMTMKYQATLGKMAAGIIVIPEKSENLRWGQIIGREALKFISALILYIGFIMAGFTEKKQALHDKIAKTLVIHKEPNKKFGIGAKLAIIVASILPVLLIGGIILWLVLSGLIFAKSKAKMAAGKAVSQQAGAQIDSSPTSGNNSVADSGQDGTSQPSGNDILGNLFNDSSMGFSVEYPSDWKEEKGTDATFNSPSVTFYPDQPNPIGKVIVDKLTAASNPDAAMLDGLVKSVEKNMIASNGKISDEKDFVYKFDDGTISTGRHFKAEYSYQGNMFKQWIILVPYSGFVYSFSYTAPPDKYDSNNDIVIDMLNSWKIKK